MLLAKYPVVTTYYAHTVKVDKLEALEPAYLGGVEGVYGLKERHLVDFSASAFCSAKNCESATTQVSTYDCHGICEHDILFDNCFGSFQFGNSIQYFPELAFNITINNSMGTLYADGTDGLK